MVPTPIRRTVPCAVDLSLVPDLPWLPMPDEELSQMPWRMPSHTVATPSLSPPPPPAPTRTPPPIPSIQPPDRAMADKCPESELPPYSLAQLVASLQAGKDINNLKQSRKPEPTGRGVDTQAPDSREADQSVEHFPPLPSLQKVDTQHSHHSSKNSAGHSYAFAGGRSHKASLTSTGSASSRRMTTEEKMSEVDEFFGLDGDDDAAPVATPDPGAGSYVVSAGVPEGAMVGLDRLMKATTL